MHVERLCRKSNPARPDCDSGELATTISQLVNSLNFLVNAHYLLPPYSRSPELTCTMKHVTLIAVTRGRILNCMKRVAAYPQPGELIEWDTSSLAPKDKSTLSHFTSDDRLQQLNGTFLLPCLLLLKHTVQRECDVVDVSFNVQVCLLVCLFVA